MSLTQAVCQWRVVNRALREEGRQEIGTEHWYLKVEENRTEVLFAWALVIAG
ncbi:hypothetical protein H6H02_01780 [Coleofasciculus sp. FACHB-1120]|nr:hypothetical protein [Coleofasciculus sp. FACHB-1120]